MNKKLLYIVLPGGIILVLLLCTVLNKWWWAKRINAKYQLEQPLTKDGLFVRSQSLRALIELYFKGTMVDGQLLVASDEDRRTDAGGDGINHG